MEKQKWLFLLCIALLSILIIGCNQAGEVVDQQQEDELIVIKIGVVGPLTGDFAAGGYSQLNGAQMKADELNALEEEAGGNIRIEIIAEDDASNVDQSINAATKVITQDEVHALVGAFNSPATLAVVPIAQKYEVPQFTVSTGTSITEQGSKWIFRLNPPAPIQALDLAKYAVEELGHTELAVAYTRDEYGMTTANAFEAALLDMGIELAANEPWTRGDKDYTGLISRIKSTPATALFLTGSIADFALIVRQLEQIGVDIQILGDTGMASPEYIELAGSAADGSIIVEPFSAASEDEEVQTFVSKYTELFGREPDSWSAECYDGIGIIYEAVKQSGEVSRQIIRDYTAALAKGSGYKGILGEVYFDETGDPVFSLYKTIIVEGQKEILVEPAR